MPYHFISDVSKKIVFLKKDKIENWLFTSTCIAGGVGVVTLVYEMYTKQLSLFDGKFPLIVPLAVTAILFGAYTVFKSSTFKLYDGLRDLVSLDRAIDEEMESLKQDFNEEPVQDSQEPHVMTPEMEKMVESIESEIQTVPLDKRSTAAVQQVPDVESDIDNLDIEAQISAAVDTVIGSNVGATSQIQSTPTQSSTTSQSVGSEQAPLQQSALTAKKTLYKNKLLQSIEKKLGNVSSARNLTDDELNRVCISQEYITDSDLHPESISMSIDDILSFE